MLSVGDILYFEVYAAYECAYVVVYVRKDCGECSSYKLGFTLRLLYVCVSIININALQSNWLWSLLVSHEQHW